MLLFVAALGDPYPVAVAAPPPVVARERPPTPCPEDRPSWRPRRLEVEARPPEATMDRIGRSVRAQGSTLLSVPHLARPRGELGRRSDHADVPDLLREAEHSGPPGRNRCGRMELNYLPISQVCVE